MRPKAKAGDRYRDQGYIKVHDGKGGKKREHRMIWEQHHGPVPEDWVVHHINGIRDDNRIENLQAMPSGTHSALHAYLNRPKPSRPTTLTPLQAIKAHCLECVGGLVREVRHCTDTECNLYIYRLGKNPRRKGVGGRPRKDKKRDVPRTKQQEGKEKEG